MSEESSQVVLLDYEIFRCNILRDINPNARNWRFVFGFTPPEQIPAVDPHKALLAGKKLAAKNGYQGDIEVEPIF